ncbi:zf-HC2 domain-containing protein [Solwaraspora sp. WMMD406]|uniref:zf-HC2 domain-containing protein n=1 Tax=Solwaraspora sp. WMMD406 TaxID=3016095 RepID=UPI002415BE4D|nr:zf-HC2 domain-containing protein [Solwaraspora sp. WMMD406]MDG4766103.1 zf-HC2 domain-containing protein [Solwaraspora sp. WMMD406]
MGCADFRELLSAELDGEATAAQRVAAEEHLSGCAGCRSWYAAAGQLTALVNAGGPVPAVRVDPAVLDALPTRRRLTAARVTMILRWTLGLLGVAQFLLGAAQIGGVADGHLHVADPVGGSAPNHLWHESAAWNVALGAGFVWIALRRTRPSGILPTLTAFVAALALLSVNDLLVGRVDNGRLLSHGFVVLGYLLLIGLSRRVTDLDSPPGTGRQRRSRWRVDFDEEPRPAPAPAPTQRLRLITGGGISARSRDDQAA